MNKRHYNLSKTLTVLAIITSIFLINCKSERPLSTSVITEVYEVKEGASDNYAKGNLKYMEQESFKKGILTDKTIYNEDQSIRGKEVYIYEKGSPYPTGSKYYDKEGNVQSTYKFQFQDSLKTVSEGYEGEGGDLLRIERFQYDDKGNMVRRTIYDSQNQRQRSFLFGHDKDGNEIKMVLLNEEDKQVLSEAYEVVSRTKEGEWLEKWGYLNDAVTPVTFYHKRKSDL
jgi:hypothetical protein